ncbi:hypothetical protein KAH37_01035, partial [bacterium]|nr:hypothetical protein [bacterium]
AGMKALAQSFYVLGIAIGAGISVAGIALGIGIAVGAKHFSKQGNPSNVHDLKQDAKTIK